MLKIVLNYKTPYAKRIIYKQKIKNKVLLSRFIKKEIRNQDLKEWLFQPKANEVWFKNTEKVDFYINLGVLFYRQCN